MTEIKIFCGALLVLLPLVGMAANSGPDAGQLLRSMPTAPAAQPAPSSTRQDVPVLSAPAAVSPASSAVESAASKVKVRIESLTVTGATVFDTDTLQAQIRDAIGQELDFAGLQALSERITQFYRSKGYLLARAYLPPQKIRGGSIEIAVLEGRLGQLQVETDAGPRASADEALARSFLRDLRPGEPLRETNIERDLMLLSDLPGVKVQSVLRPGQMTNTTDLTVQVHRDAPPSSLMMADNYGSRYTGQNRVTAHVGVMHPFSLGDTLDLTTTLAGMQIEGSDFRYLRVGWSTPTDAGQISLASAWMAYHLGAEFISTDAGGTADDLTLQWQQALLRSRDEQRQLQFTVDLKRFNDHSLGVEQGKRAQMVDVVMQARSSRSDGRSWQGNIGVLVGHLMLGDLTTAQLDDLGHRTAGVYSKVHAQGDWQWSLPLQMSVSVRGVLQAALGRNLDSSEKMGLGGPQAVRAFVGSEAMSDTALQFSTEIQRLWTPELLSRMFIDIGRGVAWRQPLAGAEAESNVHQLAGVGLGLEARLSASWLFGLVSAWKTQGHASSPVIDCQPRLWATLSRGF